MSAEEDLYESVYAVPLSCESCVNSVSKALGTVEGIKTFNVDLQKQQVSVEASVAPSAIIQAIQTTGRDAIIRGAGNLNSAAVCILESFAEEDSANPVRGLARIVSVGPSKVLIDLSLNGLPKGTYFPTFRASGNIWKGALTTGDSILDLDPIAVDRPANGSFSGQYFIKAPASIADLVGRSMAISTAKGQVFDGSLVGVIARSAGVWENDKKVCSCTGKTVWQERADAVNKGITA
ncbi:unnamed protein product [Kuraishia capsulata CBS 1993]|uniref:Superoxide dismutase 1 copper chaperone n=1 Tax=Kuraishia capsulata CBS 1993 TaxID=1382522 RepID=W6MGH4_9ASCO|nr:uncharacterized protein KUCA_T00000579001 [Kuraishia capsulata CBS 1993]CDK24613.1 unnamed protein product [Kuraishia capsulata CBS 1993]